MAAKRSAPSGSAQKEDISPAELSQRVAVIKRFKELLKAQRDRFSAYLNALDKQKDVIQSGSASDLLRHVELEEKIVADIFSIQKVIDPLEKMYRETLVSQDALASSPEKGKHLDGDEVFSLKDALEGLKNEAVVRSKENKELLLVRMDELRTEIKSLRSNPYTQRRPGSATVSTQIDIKG